MFSHVGFIGKTATPNKFLFFIIHSNNIYKKLKHKKRLEEMNKPHTNLGSVQQHFWTHCNKKLKKTSIPTGGGIGLTQSKA